MCAGVSGVWNAGIFTNAAGATSGAVTRTGSGSLVNDGTINGGVTHTSTGSFTRSGTTIPAYPPGALVHDGRTDRGRRRRQLDAGAVRPRPGQRGDAVGVVRLRLREAHAHRRRDRLLHAHRHPRRERQLRPRDGDADLRDRGTAADGRVHLVGADRRDRRRIGLPRRDVDVGRPRQLLVAHPRGVLGRGLDGRLPRTRHLPDEGTAAGTRAGRRRSRSPCWVPAVLSRTAVRPSRASCRSASASSFSASCCSP